MVTAEYQREWRIKNRERTREYYRKRRIKNIERVREHQRKGSRKWRAKNPERSREYQREWRAKNLQQARQYHRKWRACNRSKCAESAHKWRVNNPEKAKANRPHANKIYRITNRERLQRKANEYRRRKNRINPEFRTLCCLRSRIHVVLKGHKKASKTIDLIGTTLAGFMKHLESQFKEGMSWQNHNHNGWHIDHIIPCASFDLTDPEQQRSCFHYTNLQPLWSWENFSKGGQLR